ncbi:MAG TPA: hypothetical protein VM821_06115 [Abditibacteriaceae bacterium]|nr:hypothetical protein [Abditibacteriaceae bacterium]
MFRLFGSGVVGWGLMRLELWSWKWGVYGGAFYVLSAVLSAASLHYLQRRGWARGGQDDVLVMLLGAILLLVAITCLCRWQSRAAFDAQSATKQLPAHNNLRPPIPPPY